MRITFQAGGDDGAYLLPECLMFFGGEKGEGTICLRRVGRLIFVRQDGYGWGWGCEDEAILFIGFGRDIEWQIGRIICLVFFILLFAVGFYLASTRRLVSARVFLWVALLSLPLPWIAAELGWFVAEVGRQPWVIEGVLPTFLAVSSLSAGNVLITLVGFIVFYSTLLVVDVYLMIKAIHLGPSVAEPRQPQHTAAPPRPAPAE